MHKRKGYAEEMHVLVYLDPFYPMLCFVYSPRGFWNLMLQRGLAILAPLFQYNVQLPSIICSIEKPLPFPGFPTNILPSSFVSTGIEGKQSEITFVCVLSHFNKNKAK